MSFSRSGLSAIFIAVFLGVFSVSAQQFSAVTASSSDASFLTAARQAAQQVKTSLGGAAAKLVLVTSKGPNADVMKGVVESFDSTIVFGAPETNILTSQGRTANVIVTAFAGPVSFSTAVYNVNGNYAACGDSLGLALKTTYNNVPNGNGSLILLFGDCLQPNNNNVVQAMVTRLGKSAPIAGAARGDGFTPAVYCRGKVQSGVCMAVLVWGDFVAHAGMAIGTSSSTAAENLTQAGKATHSAIAGQPDKAALCMIFDCDGRYGHLSGSTALTSELDTFTTITGTGVPLMGTYGGGEMGRASDTSAAVGAAYSISVVGFFAKPAVDVRDPYGKLHGSTSSETRRHLTVGLTNYNSRKGVSLLGRAVDPRPQGKTSGIILVK
jgi:hypothetical protein